MTETQVSPATAQNGASAGAAANPRNRKSLQDWWPNMLDLDVLHRHSALSNPMDRGFDYAAAFGPGAGLEHREIGDRTARRNDQRVKRRTGEGIRVYDPAAIVERYALCGTQSCSGLKRRRMHSASARSGM